MSSHILSVSEDDVLATTLSEAGNKLVIVDFFATWCGPCMTMKPKFKELAEKYTNAKFIEVDVDLCQESAMSHGVSAMPTFLFFRNATRIDMMRGADPTGLEDKIKKWYKEEDELEDTTIAKGQVMMPHAVPSVPNATTRKPSAIPRKSSAIFIKSRAIPKNHRGTPNKSRASRKKSSTIPTLALGICTAPSRTLEEKKVPPLRRLLRIIKWPITALKRTFRRLFRLDMHYHRLPDTALDLCSLIDSKGCECLNGSDKTPFENVLKINEAYLESDCDEQLIITVSFNQAVKLHSLKIYGPPENGPKTVKIFLNQSRTLDFDSAEHMEPVQELQLTKEDLTVGATTPLRYVKFQNVNNIILFIKDNQGGKETTRIDYLCFIGCQAVSTNMSDFKRVAGKKGESH